MNDINQRHDTKNGNFLAKWGSNGTGNGQFLTPPEDIAIDSSDNVFVADSRNQRIQKFDSNGNFITKWKSEGREVQFNFAQGIAVDSSSGYVYVVDTGNDRIQVFASST